MAGLILVDTDILIDVARSDERAVARIVHEESQNTLSISVITKMELIVGCRNKKELKALEQFLDRFEVVTLDSEICEKAINLLQAYRLSHGLLIADSLIAATALVVASPLLSKNQKDYKFIDELNLVSYP